MFQENSKNSKQMFVITFIAMILGQAAWSMVFLFVPLHLTTKFDLDFSVLSQVTTAALFLSILFTFIGGWLSDAIGRIRTIFLGVFLGATSSGLMIFLPSWQITSMAYILSTIATAIIGVTFWVLMIENSSWKYRGLFIGLVLGGISFFNQQSQGFATALVNRIGENATEIFGLIAFGAAIVLLAWPAFRSSPLKTSSESIAQNLEGVSKPNFATILFWVLLIQVVSEFGFGVGNLGGGSDGRQNVSGALGLALEQNYAIIDAQFAFAGTFIMLIAMAFSGWLSDKFGERKILATTLLLACFGGFLPFLILGNFRSLLSQVLVIGLCGAIFSPPLNSFLSKILPERNRGRTYGVFSGISSILFVVLLSVQNAISDEYQKALPFVILLLLALAFLVVSR
jgi:MFS family permease